MAKLPRQPDPARLESIEPELCELPAGELVARIYFSESGYGTKWNSFRFFGPTPSRFDHHVCDMQQQPVVGSRGIQYLASGQGAFQTSIAEVFQKNRVLDADRKGPTLVTFLLKRSITLLDLRGAFPTTIGASSAIHTGSRVSARSWSRALYERYEQIDGLAYCSSMNGLAPAIALFERASDAVPDKPLTHRRLSDPLLGEAIEVTACKLGYLLKCS